ncbi:Mobile element protein [uncultured Gammaproteobacteria bacterium]|nr:Mobile element protein [uncultured Gammaproteobacteria bacterium]
MPIGVMYIALWCVLALTECHKKRKQQASTFKEYEPGYLHIDVTYLPKLAGKKQYLFVAIDRATRVLYFEILRIKPLSMPLSSLIIARTFIPLQLRIY